MIYPISAIRPLNNWGQGPVSRKSRKLFGPEKPFVKLRPAYSVKLVFSYVVKGIKIKITAKFRASRRLSFEDTKRIMSPEMRPKSLGTFEKQALGARLSEVPKLFRRVSGEIFSLYLQSEGVSRHETMQLFQYLSSLQHMKRSALQNKRIAGSRMVLRARNVFGTFEKRATGIIRPE